MSELDALAVAEQVLLSPVVFSMRPHYQAGWLVKSAIELATSCVEYAAETDEDPYDLASFVVAKFGQAAIKRDTLKTDYMLQEAYRELVEDRAFGLLKEYDEVWEKATEHLALELSDFDEDEPDEHSDEEKADEPLKSDAEPSVQADVEAKKDEPSEQSQAVVQAQTTEQPSEQSQPTDQAQQAWQVPPVVEAKKDEPLSPQGQQSEVQQVVSESQKAGDANESPLKAIAVADLKIDSKFRKALIAAGLNTVEDVVKYHQEKGLASLPVIGEKSAASIISVIEGLKG